ncbi:ParB/RepB/Spo0J family partition protein [Sphingorhabdus sp.]|jgi:ParB family chromosome partitioning protein|uniref:ParB/RepB/Spo0J family partition protein n=1 Tax=Sphingorhabdus sp. TaxID=1902408 RepID=UPI002C11C256|nr:ParB/RepB/Spo0J family partition protein [Sphingorhabdus sp.]HMT41612.1 ParB/RepB/Spo0J family partition protein [Sphingorhabdus sp.]
MIKSIPLNKLVASPRNVRKRSDPVADAELKASVAAHGLLQNLVVREGKKGQYEVEAGERRRRALLALAADKHLSRTLPIMCLVLDGDETQVREASLAENFHTLKMNPADEAQAFASIIETGATPEDVARRFGLTVRFVEGRLRLASLAPVVFEALAAGEITLDMAKAYGATSDQAIQARVYDEVVQSCYRASPDSIRRMVLNSTVRGSDPRAKLVGKDAYLAAGGRVDRELFDDEENESWLDVALLENLANARMEEAAASVAAEQGLAWVKPTLDVYVSHDLVEGLHRVPVPQRVYTEDELARIEELDAAYDAQAVILEDEDASEDDTSAASEEIERIDAEIAAIRDRPVEIDADIKRESGMILTLGRDGVPTLQPQYFTNVLVVNSSEEGAVEVVSSGSGDKPARAAMSQRLVDELAMQRRDVLALHVASDPALALDLFVFILADADTYRWSTSPGLTIRGSASSGPAHGFEAKDAAATAAIAELRGGLDESWRAGDSIAERFDLFRRLDDEARSAWLGWVVGRTLEASLNVSGNRGNVFHDHLGQLTGIDMAAWWRPTAANYFDRVSKAVILEALTDVGGPTLASRFSASKKGELAASAERIFAGNFITEVEVKERALAWLPPAMRFADTSGDRSANETDAEIAADAADGAEPDADGSTALDPAINRETTNNAGVELAA